jgi:hypothetical protein
VALKKWAIAALALLLVGCATPTATPAPVQPTAEALPAPEEALPVADLVTGWSQPEENRTYSPDTLYDFMNGAADLYFTYGFESLAVGKYEHGQGGRLRVEVYRTATDADAFGLFTYNSFGEAIDLGVDARWASGTGLAFWQRRTFVQIIARDQVDDAALRAFGEAVAAALPAGGERPVVVGALPGEGLQSGNVHFFREQMALENFLWLGAANVLGLGPDVEGTLADYALDGQTASLLLVAFPDAKRAQDALTGLEGAEVDDLVAAIVQGNAMGAVFGQVDGEVATSLLDQALGAVQ